jgi:hypothetical protein
MKTEVICIWVCLLMILPAFAFSGLARAQSASALEEATFCTQGSTRPCPDVGICTGRVKTCENGKWSDTCSGGTPPAPQEICDNGLDDNCNGLADECVSLSGSIGIFLIIGGIVLLGFAILLSRFIK